MTLDEAKDIVSDKFLGMAGIHGVGMKRKQRAISLYVENDRDARLQQALRGVRAAIQPYDVILVSAPRPQQFRD